MKATFESISASANASFVVRRFEERHFSAPYHFHPEYELTLIVEGSGKRYVGAHFSDYSAGELVLLGSNLPHCWKTNPAATTDSVSIVIQFQSHFLGDAFFQKPELHAVQQLLQNSQHGLQFTGATTAVKNTMQALLHEGELFQKLMLLLQLLQQLATATSYELLDKQRLYAHLSPSEQERLHAVTAFIVENFQGNISLADAAATAHLTPHAFCKYFKRTTRKTFIEAVNDYRVDFAVQQLVHTGKTIAQIGFDSGFEELSNFYRTFRRRTGYSPLRYRQRFVKELE